MKTYKYAWNSAKGEDVEKALNELGSVGWRLAHIEWDEQTERYLYIVEKEETSPLEV